MRKLKLSLPYNMVLTLVFKKNIELEGETLRAFMNIKTYNDWSLHHMEYQKVDGH